MIIIVLNLFIVLCSFYEHFGMNYTFYFYNHQLKKNRGVNFNNHAIKSVIKIQQIRFKHSRHPFGDFFNNNNMHGTFFLILK